MKRQTPVIGNCCGFITLLSPSQVGDSEGWMPCPMSSIRAPQKPTARGTHQCLLLFPSLGTYATKQQV